MSSFKVGQELVYKKAEEALPDILRMVQENIRWLEANSKDRHKEIIDQYKFFVENVDTLKTITIYKKERKLSKTKKDKEFTVYTLAIRYTTKNGPDRCLFIYNLYDYKDFNQLTPDKFNIKPDFLYTALSAALTDYFNLLNIKSVVNLETLKQKFNRIQQIIDDIPSFNEETKLLEYSENSPQVAAYFDGANKTETYILSHKDIQAFIISAIINDIADQQKITGDFGDESHSALHPGPGLGNSDLILTYDSINYNVEIKNIYTNDIDSGLKHAANNAHNTTYMVAYLYRLNELRVYALDFEKRTASPLCRATLKNTELKDKLIDPESLPKTYAELYQNIDNAIAELKLQQDANEATDDLILVDKVDK